MGMIVVGIAAVLQFIQVAISIQRAFFVYIAHKYYPQPQVFKSTPSPPIFCISIGECVG
jgi:hypothetical protein